MDPGEYRFSLTVHECWLRKHTAGFGLTTDVTWSHKLLRLRSTAGFDVLWTLVTCANVTSCLNRR
jgi:hypothetical protein